MVAGAKEGYLNEHQHKTPNGDFCLDSAYLYNVDGRKLLDDLKKDASESLLFEDFGEKHLLR